MIEPGHKLGPYVVLRKLGAGGMGDVYRAHDPRLDREVALKLLPADFAADSFRLGLFRREALALATLNHPGIAVIHGFEEPEPGLTFLVLELVEGESLAERLRREPLPMEDALRIAARMAEALEAAHERGIIHRDLKPGNVMLGPRGTVKVLDFGLARRVHADWKPPATKAASPEPMGTGDDVTLLASRPAPPTGGGRDGPTLPPPDTDTTMVADPTVRASTFESLSLDEGVTGTPGYMSPEQILARPQDARTDIFALGCILYEALAGRRAFRGASVQETLQAALHREPDLAALPARVPPGVRDLVASMLAREPERRPADMRAVRHGLEEALGIRRAAAILAGEAPPVAANNLPVPQYGLVGRDVEVEACRRLLDEARLLTLTGVAGTGKTRLAVHLAHDALPAFPDGAWFVDLAPVAEPDRVASAMAVALRLHEEPGRTTLDTLREHLRGRRLLLVVDNCEHLVEAAAGLIGTLLTGAAELKVLATSREVLSVSGEVLFTVPTLALPKPGAAARPEAVRASAAGGLFLERARQARPGFEIDAGNASAIAEICNRLDGIPLAIELAAARVKVLDVGQIRAKLDDRFRLLTGGSRTALPRQQTLRAAMQWSYDHLAEPERRLLRTLSVFSGGWTLEAAAAAWDEDGDEFEVLDLATRLIDKSLVVVDHGPGGTTRHRFLETVRQFAVEERDRVEETPRVAGRHLRYFLAVAEASEAGLVGPEQGEWMRRLDADHPNCLAALAWCRAGADLAPEGLRLAGALARYWSARGIYELGRDALRDALAHPGGSAPSPERAKALVRAGGMALYQGRYDEAQPPIEESLAVYRALGDAKGVARSLSGLATVATYRGDYAAARRCGEEVLATYRGRGDVRGCGVTLHNLAFVALCEGDLDVAAERYQEALRALREVGDLQHIALTLSDLAVATARRGETEAAALQIVAALELVRELGAARVGAYAFDAAAEVALARGEMERAARWHGAAAAVRREIGASLAPAEDFQRSRFREALAAGLGSSRLDAGLAAGAGLAFEEALGEVQGWLAGLGVPGAGAD